MKWYNWIIFAVIAIALILGAIFATSYVVGNKFEIADLKRQITEATGDKQAESANANSVAVAPAAPAAPAATSAPAAPATINSDEYHWGWDKKETKTLLPGYCVGGDVAFGGIKYYDEGGTNEATVVINNSSNGFPVYSEWGAGEFMLSDKGNLVIQIVSDEFATGGDVDAKTVRIVLVTDDGIEQTWYNSRLEIIDHK